MYVIELLESEAGVTVELRGEFDVFSLPELSGALAGVSRLCRPTLVDLSGVTFLDLQSARELAVRSLLYVQNLSFGNPSAEALASIRAFGLEGWIRFGPDVAHDAPSIFSGSPRPQASGYRHQV